LQTVAIGGKCDGAGNGSNKRKRCRGFDQSPRAAHGKGRRRRDESREPEGPQDSSLRSIARTVSSRWASARVGLRWVRC
jgi:hypothetical protein